MSFPKGHYKHSDATRKKMGDKLRGKKKSKIFKEKLSLRMQGNKNMVGKKQSKKWHEMMKGNKFRLGIPNTKEMKLKISKALRGENNPMWRGGRKLLSDIIRRCFLYRQWVSDIFIRDNFTCVLCGQRGGNLEADHFPETFADILDVNNIKTIEEAENCSELWNINKGRTLCEKCHRETPTYGKRKVK